MDVTHVVTARKLAAGLSGMAALASALADEAVWEATRTRSAKEVATVLGVSVAAVRKAVQQHNQRRRAALADRTDSGARKPTNGA